MRFDSSRRSLTPATTRGANGFPWAIVHGTEPKSGCPPATSGRCFKQYAADLAIDVRVGQALDRHQLRRHGGEQIRNIGDALAVGHQRQPQFHMTDLPHGTKSIAQPLAGGAAGGVIEIGGQQRQFPHGARRVAHQGAARGMIARNHQAARFGEAGMQREMRRHIVMKRTEAELPASFADAVHDFAARCDDDFEPRQRIALAKFLEQRYAHARVGGRREGKRQRRQRAGFDLPDVGQRFALLVQHGFGKAQQPDARFRGLRRAAPMQQRGAQAVFQIGDGLADR